MIKIIGLEKSFKTNKVLNRLDLEVKAGEIIYIKGINGSGKSTLFKLICDILEQDKGEIIIEENVRIGALIENPNFMENETLLSNLKFLASINKNYNFNKISYLSKLFQLDINSKTKLKEYSVGMRQKVGIIQALMEDQNFLIFDEPTRGLDSSSINIFVSLINKLRKENKAIIIASHDFIKEINFTSIYILKNGKLYKEKWN